MLLVNGVFSAIVSSTWSLFLHMKAIDFCMLILCPAPLLNTFTLGDGFIIDPQGSKKPNKQTNTKHKKQTFLKTQSSGKKMEESIKVKVTRELKPWEASK